MSKGLKATRVTAFDNKGNKVVAAKTFITPERAEAARQGLIALGFRMVAETKVSMSETQRQAHAALKRGRELAKAKKGREK